MKSTSAMTKGMFTILLGLSVVVFAGEAFAQGTWTTKAAMPTARVSLGAGVTAGTLYTVGGYDNGALTTLEAYDPGTDTWSTKTSMSTPRNGIGVGVVNGLLYAVGGDTDSGNAGFLASVEAYNPLTNTWSPRASMPTPRDVLGVGVVNGILYALGGQHGSGALTTVEAYNPVTDTWTTRAPMPTARYFFGVGVVNSILYAVGGQNSSVVFSTLEAYDPVTDTWSTKAPMPTARNAPASAVVNGILYVFGGEGGACTSPCSVVEAYDPATNTWATDAAMPTGRGLLAAAAIGNSVYTVGGRNSLGVLSTVEAFTPAPPNLPPTAVPGPNQSIHAGQVVNLNGSGSFDDNTPSASLQYAWTIMAKPAGSTASLTNANTATPSFVADMVGAYTIQLVVIDQAGLSSPPATVNISSENLLPTANAGNNNSTIVGTAVSFDGSGSSDPNNDPLSYAWVIVTAPTGSAATLSAATSQLPSFTPDIPGQYTVGLIVNDGFGNSPQALVTLTAISAADYAQGQSSTAINIVASLTIAQLQAPGHKNSLTNLISQAIAALQIGDIAEAKSKLSAAMSRTDGYPLRGAVDTKGPGMDWVTDPVAQASIYQALKNALDVLP